jgi:hypothetical protein
MPQGSVTTSLLIANQYRTTQFSLGSLVGSLCAGQGGWTSGQQVSMDGLRFTQSKTEQAWILQPAGASNTGFGRALAVSADGNTLAVGDRLVNQSVPPFNIEGRVYVYTRSAGVWSLQATLEPTGYIGGGANLGIDIALSSDGNTLIAGGTLDNSSVGAAWVFTRSAGVWSLQAKLVGSGNVGASRQGSSVSISADGNTAVVGGSEDNSTDFVGAVWVFTRSAGVWSQQGSKLTPATVTYQLFGIATSLSADGNTLAVGAGGVGDAYVFTRSAGVWSQQTLLVGTGSRVGLSSDGDTLAIGHSGDDSNTGAVRVFIRSAGVWSQQGSKLTPNDGTASPSGILFGSSLEISADGNIIAIGGPNNDGLKGANWIFTRTNTTWSQDGSAFLGSDPTGTRRRGSPIVMSKNGNTIVSGGIGGPTAQRRVSVFV